MRAFHFSDAKETFIPAHFAFRLAGVADYALGLAVDDSWRGNSFVTTFFLENYNHFGKKLAMAGHTSFLHMAKTYPEHRHLHTCMSNAQPEYKCVHTGMAKNYLEHRNLNSSCIHFCSRSPPPPADQKTM